MMTVLDIDLLDPPERLGLAEGSEGAFALLRVDGRPCGQAVLRPLDLARAEPAIAKLLRVASSSAWEALLAHQLRVTPPQAPMGPLPSIDIVVCTRDRPDDLEKCLGDLQALPDEGQTCLIVDNASRTDATRRLVERFPAMRYVREDRPGLDIARNRALRETRGEIVAFIDDDAVPDRLWLRNLRRNFHDPLVMGVCGLTMPLELEHEAQIAFERLGGFGRGFRRMTLSAANASSFDGLSIGAGVNMALRRSVTDLVGRFDDALDAGTRSQAGGDGDLFRRVLAKGYRMVYDPEALNWHRHRRSIPDLEKQIRGYELARFAIYTKAMLFEREPEVWSQLRQWLAHMAREVLRGRRDDDPLTRNAAISHLKGALGGPCAYLRARKALPDAG